MIPRLIFLLLAIFWVAMNVMLWRAEYGVHGGDSPVPAALVWKKILTAPDASLLSVYQKGERTGFCEFTTSIEQEMAKLGDDKPPPEGFVAHVGYKVRLNGNISFGDFTNRVKFDALVSFSPRREWREIELKFVMHNVTAEIHALATNDNFQVKIHGPDLDSKLIVRYSDLNDPSALIHSVARSFGLNDMLADFELPSFSDNSTPFASSIDWTAHRERMLMGKDPVTAYRLETRVLENPIAIHVSTLGEILRVDFPDGVTAKMEEWNR